jgi:hypothetical protein
VGRLERLADQFQAAQVLHRRQHMGRVGALSTTALEQAAVAKEREHGFKEQLLHLPRDQATAKFTQDRAIEAGIGQLQTEGMSGSRGAFRLPSPLRTGRAPLNASGSSKPYAVRRSAPLTVGQCFEWICSWQTW